MTNNEKIGKMKRVRLKFQPEEDDHLRELVAQYGSNSWELVAAQMGGRNVRQCRERWNHYLCSQTAKRPWTPEEDALLLEKVEAIGTKWTKIITYFNDRTDIQAKTHWLRLTDRRTVHELNSKDLKPNSQTSEKIEPQNNSSLLLKDSTAIQLTNESSSAYLIADLPETAAQFPIDIPLNQQIRNVQPLSQNEILLGKDVTSDFPMNFPNAGSPTNITLSTQNSSVPFQPIPNSNSLDGKLTKSDDMFSFFEPLTDFDIDEELQFYVLPKETKAWEPNWILGDLF